MSLCWFCSRPTARRPCYSFPCQIALITRNSFGEEAGKGCKWINKCSNTKCLITVLTLNYRGKLLATSVWGVTHHRAETRSLSNGCVSYHTAYQLRFNNVLGVRLRADLDPSINYHSNAHKPRSHFSVSRSIKAIPCLFTLSVSLLLICLIWSLKCWPFHILRNNLE